MCFSNLMFLVCSPLIFFPLHRVFYPQKCTFLCALRSEKKGIFVLRSLNTVFVPSPVNRVPLHCCSLYFVVVARGYVFRFRFFVV